MLTDRIDYALPDSYAGHIPIVPKLVGQSGALRFGMVAVTLEHQVRSTRQMSISGITPRKLHFAVYKRLKAEIAGRDRRGFEVVGDGIDFDRRGCRQANCSRVRLC